MIVIFLFVLSVLVQGLLPPSENTIEVKVKVKVKQSRNRPAVAQRVPGGLGSLISMTFRHMKVVRSSASRTGRLLPQGNIPGTHFH